MEGHGCCCGPTWSGTACGGTEQSCFFGTKAFVPDDQGLSYHHLGLQDRYLQQFYHKIMLALQWLLYSRRLRATAVATPTSGRAVARRCGARTRAVPVDWAAVTMSTANSAGVVRLPLTRRRRWAGCTHTCRRP